MQDWLAVLKWLPCHLLLPQLGLSSSMSNTVLSNDLFPDIVFPTEPSRITRPDPPWLLFEPRPWKVIRNIPPVFRTTTLLFTSNKTIPAEKGPRPRTTFPWSIRQIARWILPKGLGTGVAPPL